MASEKSPINTVHELYDGLEQVLDVMARLAVTDTEQAANLRQVLGDTVMAAEQALANLDQAYVRPLEESGEPLIDLYSEDAFHIIRRFCYAHRNELFTMDTLRAHLEKNGVDTSEVTYEELLSYFDSIVIAIHTDLKTFHDQSFSWLEEGDYRTFYVPVSEFEQQKSEACINEQVIERVDEIPSSSTPKLQLPIAKPAPQPERSKIKLDALYEVCADYIAKRGGAAVRKEFVGLLVHRSGLGEEQIQTALKQLLDNGMLYSYREGGRQWLTIDQGLAIQKRDQYHEQHRNGNTGGVEKKLEQVDISHAEDILTVFLGPNTHVQKLLTPKEIWLAIEGEGVNEAAFTPAVKSRINSTVSRLVDAGLMIKDQRGHRRGPNSRSKDNIVQKMGLYSQAVKEELMLLVADKNLSDWLKIQFNQD